MECLLVFWESSLAFWFCQTFCLKGIVKESWAARRKNSNKQAQHQFSYTIPCHWCCSNHKTFLLIVFSKGFMWGEACGLWRSWICWSQIWMNILRFANSWQYFCISWSFLFFVFFRTLRFCMGKCVSLLSRLTIIIVIIRWTLNFGKCYKMFHQVYGWNTCL